MLSGYETLLAALQTSGGSHSPAGRGTPPNKALSARDAMEYFFKYFRQRILNIRALGSVEAPRVPGYAGSMLGEQLILASSGIDTLACHWARVWRVSSPQGAPRHVDRMRLFLAQHGDTTIWNRVAMPHFFRDRLIEPAFLERVDKLPLVYTEQSARRKYTDDCLLDELRRQLKPLTRAEDESFSRHTYGSILYENYRNVWVHRGGGPGGSQSILDGLRDDEPFYENWIAEGGTETKRVLMLPINLLLRTYECAIESLERACIAEQKDPEVGLDSE